ncbi:DUF2339 domain-containing protein [Cohnella sp. JJ-181]|uniref:DUF2339 domain-containing protein n=1 Tax=Cohnella rhizoplanae TaxID=2974897 RepID=UPI0022FF5771|nr:DUF2339 domain-containing protein [Cohnella sp. JJ-181]CAI6084537.1 hypothetical protein COHCIP112018_04371 [Cohnella sp. JJ-181]
MTDHLRKHWTSLLGVALVLTAFITLFRYTIDRGWITDPMKIGFGLLAGVGFALVGARIATKPRGAVAGEIGLGLGACVLYATVAFAGIAYALWAPMTVLLGMIAVTALAVAYAWRFGSRLLMHIALAGGLLSPMLMLPETDQVFALFLYLLVLNAAFFSISIAKGWSELRPVAFAGTWALYAIYFFWFDPALDGWGNMPIRYALAAFLFYHAGCLIASMRLGRCFDGMNMYLSLANGILFGVWALIILQRELHNGYTLAFIGLLFLAAAAFVLRQSGRTLAYALSHGLSGALLVLIALSQLGSGLAVKPMLNVYLWAGVAIALAAASRVRKHWLPEALSMTIWFIVGVYWFSATWTTPRGDWFGAYVPFLNWGALSWMLLAALGFYYAIGRQVFGVEGADRQLVSNIFALGAHLVIGGLLTVQIIGLFEAYDWGSGEGTLLRLGLSLAWGVYALLLFLWGAYRRETFFRWFGSAVLVAVALKAMILDLQGEETLLKVLVLLGLGGISFLITWVNGRWSPRAEKAANGR